MNIVYEAELIKFEYVAPYDIFRFSDGLFMKVPELTCHVKVSMDDSTQVKYCETSYNALRLNADCAIDAYKNFAQTALVQVLNCDLIIRE